MLDILLVQAAAAVVLVVEAALHLWGHLKMEVLADLEPEEVVETEVQAAQVVLVA